MDPGREIRQKLYINILQYAEDCIKVKMNIKKKYKYLLNKIIEMHILEKTKTMAFKGPQTSQTIINHVLAMNILYKIIIH